MRKRDESILIIGGSGFIGANLTRTLLRNYSNIHIIIKDNYNLWRLSDIGSQLHIYICDILDQKKLTKLVKKINPYAIINLATYTKYRDQKDFEKMIDVNIRGLAHLLKASRTIPYKIFVNTGSSSEYGNKSKPMKETDALNPISFYAATKASGTYLCSAFSREFKKSIVTLRPFSVYGPYEMPDRFIPTITKALIKGLPIKVTGGKERRDFIYIDDVVSAYIHALKKGAKLAGEVINIGTGKEYTNDEVIKILFTVAQKKVPIKKGAFPTRLWDSNHWIADRKKAQKLLGWKPKKSLKEGLLATYTWFEKNISLYEEK